MTGRASIIEKIKRLRERKVDRGCTEAEASAAAEKAAQLMREAQLCEEDLNISEAKAETRLAASGAAHALAPVIAYCTNCTSIITGQNETTFVGRNPGPEIARYLLDVCETAVRVELKKFKATIWYRRRRTLASKRQAAADFVEGLVNRLCNRLMDLFADMLSDVDRDASKQAVLATYGRGVPVTKRQRELRYNEAANAGWVAGAKVGLHHGVKTGQGATKRIGGI